MLFKLSSQQQFQKIISNNNHRFIKRYFIKYMGSIISAIYDDIKLHGSVEAAQAWRERVEIPYFPDPEVVEKASEDRKEHKVIIVSDKYICADFFRQFDETIIGNGFMGDSKPDPLYGDDGRG